eukprot:91288_1
MIELKDESEEKQSEISEKLLNTFRLFVLDEEYDSETLEDDFTNKNESNVFKYLSTTKSTYKSVESVYTICQKFISRTHGTKQIYSNGYRYFYWPFYKDNNDEENVLFKHGTGGKTVESNPGYELKEWYIASKYANFKEEILSNLCCPFSLYQFQVTYDKAQTKLN